MQFKINQYKLDMPSIKDMNSAFITYQPTKLNPDDETTLRLTFHHTYSVIVWFGETSQSKHIYPSQYWAQLHQYYIDHLGPFV